MGGVAEPWGSLPLGDEPVDVDATAPLVVWVATRRAVVALDRETGVVRERLDLAPLRRHPEGDALGPDAELRAVRSLRDGSLVALPSGSEVRLVVWDPGRRVSVAPVAVAGPALDLERTGDGLAVLGGGGEVAWVDVRGRVVRRARVPGAVSLTTDAGRLVAVDAEGRHRGIDTN